MQEYRRFFWFVVVVVATLVLISLVTWQLATRKVLSGDPMVGDLARMGYLPHLVEDVAPPQTSAHLEFWEYDEGKVDIVTLGDSFSQGFGGSFYQAPLTAESGMKVLNLSMLFSYPKLRNRLDVVVTLLNSGFFDKLAPRYLILENAERLGSAIAQKTDWGNKEKTGDYLNFLARSKELKRQASTLERKGFLNPASFRYLANRVSYALSGHDIKRVVYTSKLSKPLFSTPPEKDLAFFFEDIDWAQRDTAALARTINDNLNQLASLLCEHNIELIYLPAVNKLNLYAPYFVGHRYAESRFFETLRTLDKSYHWVDSKAVLAQEIAKGERDIFRRDDTHWGVKASRIIAKAILAETNP
ncbi:MAG: hypothetical protein C0621_08505 [Desulfuromonas sp.]|nr:MAG: hypothetical protein C0621_08505 [Desulfuromonas sp.]